MPPGLLPTHKAALVLFMDRVYGVPDQETFLRILENAFLPDMRTATTLDSVWMAGMVVAPVSREQRSWAMSPGSSGPRQF